MAFHFKHFSLTDSNSIMKIGTDSVLLGAWINQKAERILDIGAGCGILSIMLGFKTNASVIDAVEIHSPSSIDAELNAKTNNLNNINVYNTDFKEFIKKHHSEYDLIVSNPPFFTNSLKSPNRLNNIKRHDSSLDYETIIFGVNKFLSNKGHFYIILPAEQSVLFENSSLKYGLYINCKLLVSSKIDTPHIRCLMKYGRNFSKHPDTENLTIRNKDNSFTEEYKNFTKDYYLDF